MSIYAAARGTVVGAPARITTESGHITVLVLKDAQDEATLVAYEVSCPDPELGQQVLERVGLGDRLVVLGLMRLTALTGPLEDPLSGARVTLIAEGVSVEVGATHRDASEGGT
jgi:hypothetical protein